MLENIIVKIKEGAKIGMEPWKGGEIGIKPHVKWEI